jgi:hypothetical protein
MKRASRPRKAIWLGLVEVKPLPECDFLGGKAGAFVNILTWASTKQEYRKKVQLLLSDLRLRLVDIEAPEPLTKRLQRSEVDEEISELARQAAANPNAILHATFHTWPTRKTRRRRRTPRTGPSTGTAPAATC